MNFNKHGHRSMISKFITLFIVLSLAVITVYAQAVPTVSDFNKSGLKNESINITAADFSAHFTDTNDPALPLQKVKITALNDPAAGTLKLGDGIVAAGDEIAVENLGAFVFVPNTDWTGATSFTWKGSNGTDYSANDGTVNLSLSEPVVVNQPPAATDLSLSTPMNTPVSGTLTATDPEGNPLTFTIVTQPQSGIVALTDAATGAFTYTPNAGVTGTDSFTFKANDGTSDSNTATVTVSVTAPPPPAAIYSDLVNHWAQYSASRLAERGVIMGEKIAGKYYFYPDRLMNRAEFNLFLNSALGIDSDTLGSDPAGYADENIIPIWVLHEARAAKKAGLINGVRKGNKTYYNAYDKLNRLETLVILHNALKPDANDTDPLTYTDSNAIPGWAVQYVKNMRGYGIIKGYPDNSFHPNDTITRAQAAELLYQLIKYKEANPST